MKRKLEEKYRNLFDNYDLGETKIDTSGVVAIIWQSLHEFVNKTQNPAIYGTGEYKKILMNDFMFELKGIKYFISDQEQVLECESREGEITEEEIGVYKIDGIILASNYEMNKILKERLKKRYPDIFVLNIQEEILKQGIELEIEYYLMFHPYQYYKKINQLQRDICQIKDGKQRKELYRELVSSYLYIKDFRTALIKLEEWTQNCCLEQKEQEQLSILRADVAEIYELEKKAAACLSNNHVVMILMDGLGREDFYGGDMPRMVEWLSTSGYQYTNAYSYSTSTYESLIPAYSGNNDFQTKYYEQNDVPLDCCQFAKLAKSQNRDIFIYGDFSHYIKDSSIHYQSDSGTITEKLWQFILDASDSKCGLFYIHELWESHFSYANPYTEEILVAQGQSAQFDFFSPIGHCITDYRKQAQDSRHYLDDVAEPLLSCMNCRMVFYADHGQIIMDKDSKLSDLGEPELTCCEQTTQIPLVICSPEMGTGKDDRLISLMEISNIITSLLKAEPYQMPIVDHIKMGRFRFYHPDNLKICHILGKEQCMMAFECFLFTNGRKIIIYEDGTSRIYDLEDNLIENEDKNLLIERIDEEITVVSKYDVAFQTDGFFAKHVVYPDREIDVLAFGDYIEPGKLYRYLKNKYSNEIFMLIQHCINKIKKEPYKIYKNALRDTFEDFGLGDVDEKAFENYISEFQKIDVYRQAYYNDLIVRTILQSGIKLHVLGAGWENFISEYDNLCIEKNRVKSLRYAFATSKIILKLTDEISDKERLLHSIGELNGSVMCVESKEYPMYELEDMKNGILIDLDELERLPEKMKYILSNERAARELIDNGKQMLRERYK